MQLLQTLQSSMQTNLLESICHDAHGNNIACSRQDRIHSKCLKNYIIVQCISLATYIASCGSNTAIGINISLLIGISVEHTLYKAWRGMQGQSNLPLLKLAYENLLHWLKPEGTGAWDGCIYNHPEQYINGMPYP